MSNIYAGKLYHGTDSKVLALTTEQRKELENICFAVSKISYEILREKGVLKTVKCPDVYIERIGHIWSEFMSSAVIPFEGRLNDSELYSYGCIFVTNSKDRAARFAKKSSIYGEQGNVARLFFEVLTLSGLLEEVPSEYISAFREFEKHTALEKRPVLVEITDVDEDCIYHENGKKAEKAQLRSICFDTTITMSFRLLNREIDLSRDKVIIIEE